LNKRLSKNVSGSNQGAGVKRKAMTDKPEVEVAIVGGGPAGAAAALALAQRGIEALLLESTHYDTVRIGETVPPAIQQPLTQLGVWHHFMETAPNPSYANQSVWGTAEIQHHDFILNPYGSGWHLDRGRFDSMLAEAARQRGVRVMTGAQVLSLHPYGAGWVIEGQQEGSPFSFFVRFLVDATGRRSTIARKIGRQQRSIDNLIGLVGFLKPSSDDVVQTNSLLLEAAENGWWYSAPLADGRLVAVYMTDADFMQGKGEKLAFWLTCLQSAAYTKKRLQPYQTPSKLSIRPANTSWMEQPAGPNFLAVGDAAVAFDPLSSQGIYKALRGAIRTAEIIAEVRDGQHGGLETYALELRNEFNQYLELRTAYYRLETRWPDSLFWQRRWQIAPQRPEITLHPMRQIHFQEQANSRSEIEQLKRIYSFPSFDQLCELCRTPRLANEVIATFKKNHGDGVDDLSLIIALQLLIEHDIVK
jgi:Dehydrogenases (flavoproteins)